MLYNGIEFFKTKYEDYYVSKCGQVFSFKRNKILKPKIDKDGYCEYTLRIDKNPKYLRGHRIVAETFLENPKNKPTVNHKDGNRQNNNLSNLEWATYSENNQHRYDVLNYKKLVDYSYTYIHDGIKESNLSKEECWKKGVSKTYLNCIVKGTKNKFFIYCEKQSDSKVFLYWNGEVFKTFNCVKECAKYFNLALNSMYIKLNHHKKSEYITRNCKIIVTPIK